MTCHSGPACAEGERTPREVPAALAQQAVSCRSSSEEKEKTTRGWAEEFTFIGPGSSRKCLAVQSPNKDKGMEGAANQWAATAAIINTLKVTSISWEIVFATVTSR